MVSFYVSFLFVTLPYIIFQCKVQCFHFLETGIQSDESHKKIYEREIGLI